MSIESQRRLQVGLAAKQDKPDAVAASPGNKVAEQVLDQFQPADLIALPLHVWIVHGTGHVDRQQQVAAIGGKRQRFAEPLRAGGGEQQQTPDEQVGQLLPPGRQGDRGAAASQRFQLGQKADLQCRVAAFRYG